jgi:hypothetical protein
MPKYQLRGSREPPSSLQSWLRRGPPENCHEIEILSLRLQLRNQVDINVSARILILVGVTSDRIDSRLCLYSSPTIRRQDGLQLASSLFSVADPWQETYLAMPSTLQSIPGIAGLRRSFPSSVLIVGPRKRLKASRPAASAIASCRSRLRPWLVSIDDENLVSSPQWESLQMRKTFCQR